MMSATIPAAPAMAEPLQIRPIALLTLGHLTIDLCQGLVPALVPFLVIQDGYTFAASGGLVFAASALSSIVQPLFGRFADRGAIPHLLPGSIVLTGAALAIGSQIEFYPVLVLAIACSGLGIAAFHPEAARRTFLSAGRSRTTAMSLFSLGGSIGFALAPMLAAFLLTSFGRQGVLFLFPIAALAALPLAWEFGRPVAAPDKTSAQHHGIDDWLGFWTLSIGVIMRSITFFGINTFIALFWKDYWHLDLAGGTLAQSVFLMSGIAGILVGGWWADRIGRRAVIQIGFGLSLLLFPLAFMTPNPTLGLLFLGLAAAAFFAPSSPAVVLGQEYLPQRVGVASGVTIGLAVSTGGMMAPVLGRLGDLAGLQTVFVVLECLLLVCFVSTLLLPAIRKPAT